MTVHARRKGFRLMESAFLGLEHLSRASCSAMTIQDARQQMDSTSPRVIWLRIPKSSMFRWEPVPLARRICSMAIELGQYVHASRRKQSLQVSWSNACLQCVIEWKVWV